MRIKPITSLLIILAMAFIITGVIRYMDNINDDKWPTPEEQLINWYTPMVEYINERYEDDTFEFIRRDSWSNDSIFVSSEKFPDERIMVSHVTGDGIDYFNDNYLHFKFREQAAAYIAEVLSKSLDYEFKLFYNNNAPAVVRAIFPADISFNDYISNLSSQVSFKVVVSPGSDMTYSDKVVEILRDAFAVHNIAVLNASVRFCEDVDVYESLDTDEINHFTVSNTEPWLSIYHSSSHDRVEFIWMEPLKGRSE